MGAGRRLPLFAGLLLIVIGGVLLVDQFIPEWDIEVSWPWIIIAVGVGLLMLGMLTGAPAMAVPACIVGGIGGILLYQDVSGNWSSWSYLWTLIPGFAGVGTILAGLLRGDLRGALGEGTQSIIFSAVAFALAIGGRFPDFPFNAAAAARVQVGRGRPWTPPTATSA